MEVLAEPPTPASHPAIAEAQPDSDLTARLIEAAKQAQEIRERKARFDQRREQWHILRDAQTIGADYYQASGELPSLPVLESLSRNGYCPPPDQFLGIIFYDLDDYHAHVLTEAEHRVKEESQQESQAQARKEDVLSAIDEGLSLGILPEVIFHHFNRERSEESQKVRDLAVFTEKELDETERIVRYAKYRIASELVVEKEVAKRPKDIEAQRISIAIGVYLDTNRIAQKSFLQRILASNVDLGSIDLIKETAVYENWSPYLEVDNDELRDRQKYLESLLAAAGEASTPGDDSYNAAGEYFYNRQTGRVLCLGTLALTELIKMPEGRYLKFLDDRGKLDLQTNGSLRKTTVSLREIATTDHGLKVKTSREVYMGLERADLISLGHLLLNVMGDGTEPGKFDKRNIQRLYDVGITPAPDFIVRRFGSFSNFASQFGFNNRAAKGRFNEWTPQAYRQYGQAVLAEQGKVTVRLLQKLFQESPLKNVPTSHHIDAYYPGGMGAFLADVGSTPHNRRRSDQSLIDDGVRFAIREGRPPKRVDIESSDEFSSVRAYQRRFGSLRNYQALIDQVLAEGYPLAEAA